MGVIGSEVMACGNTCGVVIVSVCACAAVAQTNMTIDNNNVFLIQFIKK